MIKTVISIQVKKCTHTYGVAPCTASGAANSKCYNTFKTCQDTQNFDNSLNTNTIYFNELGAHGIEFDCIPALQSFRASPPQLKPWGLALRDKATLSLSDFRDRDYIVDPYRSERDAGIYDKGTFWQRFTNRYEYELINAEVRVYVGNITDAASLSDPETEEYLYIIKDWELKEGGISFELADPLSLIDLSKTKAVPQPRLKLANDYPATGTDAIYIDPVEDLAAVDDFGFNHIRINDEIMLVGTQEGGSLKRLVGIARAQFGTEAEEHKAGDPIQQCRVYNGTPLKDVLLNLLEIKIDSNYIDSSQINGQFAGRYDDVKLYGIISDYKDKVQEIIDQLCKLFRVQIFWNRTTREVNMKTLQVSSIAALDTLDDDSIIKIDSWKYTKEYLTTQIAVYSEIKNHAESPDESKNYNSIKGVSDEVAGGELMYKEHRPQIHYGRLVPESESSFITTLISRTLASFRTALIEIELETSSQRIKELSIGDYIFLNTNVLLDYLGDEQLISMQIMSIKLDLSNHTAKLKLLENKLDNVNYATIGSMEIGNSGTGTNTAVMF